MDPFAGSGTTAVACINLRRKYFMIDIVEEYKKIALERLENGKNRIE